MRKHLLITAFAGAALALSACSDDGTGPGPAGDGVLTAAEAAQLNQAILGMSAGVRSRSATSRSTEPTGQSTGSLNFTFDETASCQPGGSVGVAGGMSIGWDDAARTSTLSTDFAVEHDACAHRLDNGQVITLTGDPDIDVSMDVTTGPGGLTSFVIRETGAFTWSKDAANNGRCSLDVTAQLNPATGAVTLSGSFCGTPVSGTFQER
ncbi:MAG TPA: hypothetical protein VE871_03070 [Longimicrobium sp.]|nr:hypothetical protein [Longimicrobium sp.]